MKDIQLEYGAAGPAVEEDRREAHRRLLDHFRRPGAWFSGAQRIAIASESRLSLECPSCRERVAALSPEHAQGKHASTGQLSEALVDAIHRIRTDPGRLSKRWFERVLESGVTEGQYVEAVGIVALCAGLDSFCRSLGVDPFPLPGPLEGEPSHHRPEGLTKGIAWVSLLKPEDASGPDADIYGGGSFVPNIVRALSVVPDHVRVLRAWSNSHYVKNLTDLEEARALDRPGIELVAARVSALNECFY